MFGTGSNPNSVDNTPVSRPRISVQNIEQSGSAPSKEESSHDEGKSDQDDQLQNEEDEGSIFDRCKAPRWWRSCSKCYSSSAIYKFFNAICHSQVFNYIILLAIAVNTVALSMDRYPIEDEQAKMLESINFVTTWIFVGEMVIKLIGLGVATYISAGMNQFDAFVVIVSMVEVVLTSSSTDDGNSNEGAATALTLFRGFRLLRVFRLARRWHSFHRMMVKIAQTVIDILSFFVLVLVIVLVFSLLGVELFSNYVKIDKDNNIVEAGTAGARSPRLNFDNPLNGIVAVFTCLIGDDWQFIMHDLTRAK